MPAFALSLGQAQQQQQQQHDHKIRDYFEEEKITKKRGICYCLQGYTYHVNILLGFEFALFCILEKEIQM